MKTGEARCSAAALPGADMDLWHRRVWRIAGPIMLSNISVPLLGAVDTAVMGHMPSLAYLGAVAVGAMIFNFLYWGFGFLRMATTGFAAQAAGAGELGELRLILLRAGLLGCVIALCLIVLQGPIERLAIFVIDASPAVSEGARVYYEIRIWGAPATLVTYVLLGWLLGLQNARAVLWLQLTLNGLNIALKLFFVFGLGMTIDGVALATLISEYVALGLGLVIVWRSLRRQGALRRAGRLLDPAHLIALLRVNFDIFLRTLCLIVSFSLFTALSARQGDLTLAANAVLLQLLHFASYGLDGFAHAVETLTGGAVGAKSRPAFRAAVRVSGLWALATALAMALVFWALGPEIVWLFTDLADVRAASEQYLGWLIVLPLVGVWSYLLDGIFIGAMRTAALRNAMLVSTAAYLAVLWLALPALGNDGLWLSLLLFLAARGLTLAACYRSLERSLDGGAGR
jgi:MATE family multidrug resistance protein